jgi:hypothetical protein
MVVLARRCGPATCAAVWTGSQGASVRQVSVQQMGSQADMNGQSLMIIIISIVHGYYGNTFIIYNWCYIYLLYDSSIEPYLNLTRKKIMQMRNNMCRILVSFYMLSAGTNVIT